MSELKQKQSESPRSQQEKIIIVQAPSPPPVQQPALVPQRRKEEGFSLGALVVLLLIGALVFFGRGGNLEGLSVDLPSGEGMVAALATVVPDVQVDIPDLIVNVPMPSGQEMMDAILMRTPQPTPASTQAIPSFAYQGQGLNWDRAKKLVKTYLNALGVFPGDVETEAILVWARDEHGGALDGFNYEADRRFRPENTPTPPYVTPTLVFIAQATPIPDSESAKAWKESQARRLGFGEGVLYSYEGQTLSENRAYGFVWSHLGEVKASPDDTKVKAVLAWARDANGHCWGPSQANPNVCGDLNGFKNYVAGMPWFIRIEVTPMPVDDFYQKYGFDKAELQPRFAQVLKVESMGGDWFVRVYNAGDWMVTSWVRTQEQKPGASAQAGDTVYKHDDGLWGPSP